MTITLTFAGNTKKKKIIKENRRNKDIQNFYFYNKYINILYITLT